MIKLGFLCNDLGANQFAYSLISSSNKFLEKNMNKVDIVGFFKNLAPFVIQPHFAIMNITEIFDYDGILIANSLIDAQQILKCPGPQKRVLYNYDLDWLRLPQRNYEAISEIYQNPNLELWARSQHHKDLIELTFNCKVKFILPDVNIGEIYKYTTNTSGGKK